MWILFNCSTPSDGPSIPTSSVAVNAIPINNHDSTFELDLSLPSMSKDRPKRTAAKPKATEAFVPAKGQKTAAARFNKIKSKYQHVHDIFTEMRWLQFSFPPFTEAIADLNSPNPDEIKSKQKTTTTNKRRQPAQKSARRQARRVVLDSDNFCSSDSDGDGNSIGHSSGGWHRNNTNYDPNVITIDCDDGYYVGANREVQIERNLTTAPSCEAADNAAMKVNIRINNKFETYDLRKVSEQCIFGIGLFCYYFDVNFDFVFSSRNSLSLPHRLLQINRCRSST